MGTEVKGFRYKVVSNYKLTPFGEEMFKITPIAKMIIRKMAWRDEDVVMDIGCGNGYKAAYVILPLIKKYKSYLAIDAVQHFIRYAKSKCPAQNLEYHVANIEDITTFPEEWLGTATKVVSFEYFFSLKGDLKTALQNAFALMAPEGEALFHFPISTPIKYIVQDMTKNARWKQYLEPDLEEFYSRDFYKLRTKDFRKMLEEVGFEILFCDVELENVIFENENEFREMWKTFEFIRVPDERRAEFLDYVLTVVKHSESRNRDGNPWISYRKMNIHVRKPIA